MMGGWCLETNKQHQWDECEGVILTAQCGIDINCENWGYSPCLSFPIYDQQQVAALCQVL